VPETLPLSLLQIAGAPTHPSPLERAALVLIDCQMEYVDGGVKLSGIGNAVDEIDRLLRLARGRGVPVFHVVHHGKPGGKLFDPQGRTAAIIPALAPTAGETVVAKGMPNAFAGTELDKMLRATGRSELIVAGFATHMCVSATVRAALDLGWRSTVDAAATATRDLPDPLGGAVRAADVQRAALTELADRFAVVVPNASAWEAG
jgi:nicotinamidase-related amidase